MHFLKQLLRTMKQENQKKYDSFCKPIILGGLRVTSYFCATDSRSQLQNTQENPKHPSLHLKKIRRYWSIRAGIHYRALAVEVENGLLWFWIGSHSDYDKLIKP